MVESFSGKFVASNAPILGTDVFTQTAGIHADGDVKGNLYVTELTPERFARNRSYALGKLAGKASLEKNLDQIGIKLNKEDQRRVLEKIIALGDSKQIITPEDLPFIIADVIGRGETQHISLVDCQITSQLGGNSEVKLTVNINGKDHQEHGKGNGAYDAFTTALDKILSSETEISRPTLVDYQIHIPKGGKTNALTEAAITWEMQDNSRIITRGVNSNQVFAAIQATLRMINTILS